MKLMTVDAFTDRPFRGNPAAVCFLDREREPAWMQAIAAEMNLSETAFLLPRGDDWSLRWFTPKVEVDLCGHATLASAHAIGAPRVRFHTKSGALTATRSGDWIELDFPALPPAPMDPPPGLLDALGVRAVHVARSRFDYLVEIEGDVRAVRPDFDAISKLPVRGVIVTGPGRDFVSRFFAPAAGVDEDPVTGSAHCVLAPYWGAKLGKTEMVGEQLSHRGGIVRVRLEGDRVILGGQAVTVCRGELCAP